MNANDTILVYFSATNRTKNVANIIAQKLGVKSVSLEPKEPYTAADLDYNNPKARVYVELQTRPNVALKNAVLSDWQSYKNVIIGYPIWWYDYAWAMNEFLTSNDFTGKNIAVFATSASSGLGASAENLAKKAKGAKLIAKKGFEMINEKQIYTWLDSVKE
ncbi:flavodoxin [Campylobacter gastrosuis]|uniref:Flavodoxin-like domain-containing protein n=1 Tax=Campylobacter gastrosuis TaxID=2974576 RepID=A0ABT7HR70_9BACT|nr:flavodoxin [Campylobacter gastrosuis]MDL0089412.1 hypothetical protein [Campylobacter gastrosuis]